jgi:hypothetical protein
MTLADKTRPIRNSVIWLSTLFFAPKLHQRVFYPETRPMINYLKKHYGDLLTGAEVGVETGVNASSILKTLSIKTLCLVDPYKPYSDDNGALKHPEDYKVLAQKKLRKFKHQTKFYYCSSVEASKLIPDGSLDFVYIDANHSYDSVQKDIDAWLPKVKTGGVLGGHDISWAGVLWPVIAFVQLNNLQLHTQEFDWWITKK